MLRRSLPGTARAAIRPTRGRSAANDRLRRDAPRRSRPSDPSSETLPVTATTPIATASVATTAPTPATSADDLLTITLDTIASERGDFQQSFRCVDQLLARHGEADLANRLYEMIPAGRPWEDVADLFRILVWSTSDHGLSLLWAMEQWLLAPIDVRQVQVALHLDVYPFLDAGRMRQVLTDVAEQYPQMSERCEAMIRAREQKA